MKLDRLFEIYRIAYKTAGAEQSLPAVSFTASGGRGTSGRTSVDFYPDMVSRPLDTVPEYNRRSVVKRPYTPDRNPLANAGRNTVRRDGRPGTAHVLPDGRGGFTHYGWSQSIPGGEKGSFSATTRKGYIRPLLYGESASAREQRETAEAYGARWRRLMELAPNDAVRKNLEERMRLGQIPPIIMRGAYGGRTPAVLHDLWFGDPREVVQATVEPGGGRSMSSPRRRSIYLGADDDLALSAWREELAHQASLTPKARGNSVVRGLLGGDDYLRALEDSGQPMGAYELDPAELTRMVLLQKAAAARLGYDRFRNVDEWSKFTRMAEHPVRGGMPDVKADTLDFPYERPGSLRLDPSTDGGRILDLLDRLRYWKDNEPDEERRNLYKSQYEQLYNALQDAIDMAKYGQQDDNRMNA